MKKLCLYFSNSNKPELFRISFEHPLCGELRVSIRGKDSGAYLDAYTFQWTQAVKALCVLILRSANDSSFVLEGEKGSLASSLDYSISKNTQWLSDVFGVDLQGKTFARRLFRRTNSDRTLPAPVGVSLNPAQCNDLEIFVYLDQVLLSKNEYLYLSKKIENNLNVDLLTPENDKVLVPNLKEYLVDIYEKEFLDSIFRTDIFTKKNLNDSILAINKAGFYKKISGKEFKLANNNITEFGRLGLGVNCSKSIFDNVSIIGSSTLIGPVIIFHYLNQMQNYKFDLNFNFPHAVSAVKMMINGELESLPDILCSGIAPAATLIGSKLADEYVPLMFLPDSSQKIVAHKDSLKDNFGFNNATYSYLKEDPSIPAFMLEELINMGKLSNSKIKLQHDEPDVSFNLMLQGNPELRAAVFFPHYNFNCDFNNCIALPEIRPRANSQEVLLFVHRRKASTKFMQNLEVVIRDAWLDLRISKEKVRNSISSLLDPQGSYFKSVVRFGGLHNIRLS